MSIQSKKSFFAASLVTLCAVIIINSTASVEADTTTVSATVATTISCQNNNATSSFGTLNIASVNTSSPNVTATMSCNSAAGCSLFVNGAGNGVAAGLYASGVSGTPIILSTTTQLTAGTEGYGIQAATSSSGTGATLGINSTYLKTGDFVGALSLSSTNLASSTAPIANREIVVTHKAAISGLTKAGAYSDTITYSCTGN